MASVADAFMRLRVDSSQVKKDVESGVSSAASGSGVKKAGEDAGKAFSSSFKSMLSMGITLVGVAGVIGGIKEVVQGGSDLQKSNDLLTAAEKAHGLAIAANAPVIKDAIEQGAKYGQTQDAVQNSLVKMINAGVPLSEALQVQQAAMNVAAVTGGNYSDVLNRMVQGGGTAARTLKSLGVTQVTGATEAKALEAASKLLNDQITQSGGLAQFAAARHLTLAQAHDLVSGALKGNVADYNKLNIEVLPKSATLAQNLAQAQAILNAKYGVEGTAATKTFAGQQAQLVTTLKDMAANIGIKVLPALSDMVRWLGQGVKWLTGGSAAAKDFIKVAGGITAVWAAWKAYGLVMSAVSGIQDLVTGEGAIAKIIAWAVAQSASLIETAALWVMYTFGVEAAGVATVIATGGIILIIAGLIAAGYELYKHWDTVWAFVKKIAKDTFDWLKSAWGDVYRVLIEPVEHAAADIPKIWDTIKGYFSDGIKFITGLFSTIGDFITKPFIDAFKFITDWVSANFDKWWAQNGEAVKEIWHGVWTAITTVFHAIWDPLVAGLRADWAVLQTVFRVGSAVLSAVWSVAWGVISAIFNVVWGMITTAFQVGMTVLHTIMTVGMGVLSAGWQAAWTIVSTVFSVIWLAIQALWKVGWDVILAVGKVAWAAIQLVVKTALDIIIGIVTVALNLLTGHWSAAWNAITALATQVWNNLKAFFSTVLGAMVTALTNTLDTVVGFFAALGGRITGAVGNLLGLLVQAGRDVVTGLLHGAEAVIGDVENFFTSIPKKILGWLGFGSPPQWAIDAGKQIMQSIGIGMTQAKTAVAGAASQVAGSVTAGVTQWSGLVNQALSMLGLPASLASRVLIQMQSESGGNPNAINLSDSNAAAGDPSRGLLQTIMSTFQAYHVAGTSSNIYDPLANIAAAINYARAVYGPTLMNAGMGMGSGHGYASGTTSARRGWAIVGERGPEAAYFHGGETVLPTSFLSRYATGAYDPAMLGGGTEQLDGILGLLKTLIDRTDRLNDTMAAVPAGVGKSVGGALGGAASDANFRSRYGGSGW